MQWVFSLEKTHGSKLGEFHGLDIQINLIWMFPSLVRVV